MKYGAIWKSDWFIGAIISFLFIAAYASDFSLLRKVEFAFYDLAIQANDHPSRGDIALLNFDSAGKDQPELQNLIAKSIHKLSDAGARFIAVDILFSEPAQAGSNHLNKLTEAVRHSGNTLMPIFFEPGDISGSALPDYVKAAAIKHINSVDTNSSAVSAASLTYPYRELMSAAAGLGHMSISSDGDGIFRSEPLIFAYGGQYFPSMALALAAKVRNIPLDDLRVNLGLDIELGASNIMTDPQGRILSSFYSAFPTYSLQDLLSGKVPDQLFNNKIVLISSNSQANHSFSTPMASGVSRSLLCADVLESILSEQFVKRPGWTLTAELALLLLIACYLTFLLPGTATKPAALMSLALFILIMASAFILLTSQLLWIQVVSSALLLLIGHAAFALKQYLCINEHAQSFVSNPDETNKMLGLSFQSQNMLEKAFEKFLICPLDDDMLSILYNLALAFERKRQYAEAVNVYQHMAKHDSAYKDIQMRMISANNSKDTVSSGDSSIGLSTILRSGDTIPTLGRYEIISELGKGAMGTVYLGRDPKINRQVAIKTMALSQEFEATELEEVKERFFHEAEIAGMLNHPNIVTIFDAGDEHDLAYITMEYLNGIDLVPYTKKGKLLPLITVLKIAAKVAEALQYAHDHGVIHRDIKPANIMILKNKTVKVTDFGIAHINDSSKTKAGVVLGTPSYMSPEQLSGKTLDGRSDLFSFGVMLYELASGERPFRGESIAKLMYKIAKEPHISAMKHNPELPVSVSILIDQLLAKKVDLRIATANEALARIQQCLRELGKQEIGQ
ncbi:MAG: serine/threonine protein kinase [Zetaproteobacteria bacterium CG1_02_53_45]|nr:MAG: serine/threonine protein kinase [Zetaproteobacteria bacterium CG1_02_53_45]